MSWVENNHNDHPVSTPSYVQGHQQPDQAAQSHIQPGLECRQGGGIHSLLGQPVPVCYPGSLHGESSRAPAKLSRSVGVTDTWGVLLRSLSGLAMFLSLHGDLHAKHYKLSFHIPLLQRCPGDASGSRRSL